MQDQALIQRHLHGFEFLITSCFLILFRGSFLFYAIQFRRREEQGVLGTVVYLMSNFLFMAKATQEPVFGCGASLTEFANSYWRMEI